MLVNFSYFSRTIIFYSFIFQHPISASFFVQFELKKTFFHLPIRILMTQIPTNKKISHNLAFPPFSTTFIEFTESKSQLILHILIGCRLHESYWFFMSHDNAVNREHAYSCRLNIQPDTRLITFLTTKYFSCFSVTVYES